MGSREGGKEVPATGISLGIRGTAVDVAESFDVAVCAVNISESVVGVKVSVSNVVVSAIIRSSVDDFSA